MSGSLISGILLMLISLTIGSKLVVDQVNTVDCHRREFTFRAAQTDENGRQCWDHVTATACWGRCDSGEIGDWRFPFKRPFHPVCVHETRERRFTTLRNCDTDADLSLAEYEYFEALSCACLICDSSTTSCQAMITVPPHHEKEVFSAPVTKPGRILPVDRLD